MPILLLPLLLHLVSYSRFARANFRDGETANALARSRPSFPSSRSLDRSDVNEFAALRRVPFLPTRGGESSADFLPAELLDFPFSVASASHTACLWLSADVCAPDSVESSKVEIFLSFFLFFPSESPKRSRLIFLADLSFTGR